MGVGFEQLAQQWIAQQARQQNLPFMLEAVGAYWSRTVQICGCNQLAYA